MAGHCPDDPSAFLREPMHDCFQLVRTFRTASAAGGLLASIAILGPTGYRRLRACGHDSVALACAPAVAPERVRLLDPASLPDVAQADAAALRAAFAAPRPEVPVRLTPLQSAGGEASVRLRVPPDLRALQRHFDRMPIVPGVLQVGWAMRLAAEAFETDHQLAGLDATKFRRIVQPGDELELTLHWHAGNQVLGFRFRSAVGVHSSGRVMLRAARG